MYSFTKLDLLESRSAGSTINYSLARGANVWFQFEQGYTTLVCGAGPIGLGMLVALKVWGARIVVVSEVTGSRMAQARKFGADLVVNPLAKETAVGDVVEGEDSVKAAVANATAAEMLDVAFVAAGHQSTLDTAIAATRSGGDYSQRCDQ